MFKILDQYLHLQLFYFCINCSYASPRCLFYFLLIVHFLLSQTPAPPKVTNLKIIGDLRENSKITVTGIVAGGTEGSSRVQWFKTSCSTLEGEKGFEALTTSKIAKVGYSQL